MKTCSRCGERFTGEEIAEWRSSREPFNLRPFICPDCYDNLQRLDLEDQLDELMREEVVAMGEENEPDRLTT